MKSSQIRRAALAVSLALSAGAQAQVPSSIPSTAPFYTDPQNEYVQDETAQGIGNLNMVLCVIAGLDPADMVNAGPYIALVDMNKCKGNSGGSGSTAATAFATATVNVTRATNSDPMIGKVWLRFTDQGGSRTVYAYLSASHAPSASDPYGLFRMDYIGKDSATGAVGFNGFINAQPGTISYLETGSNSSNTALAVSASSTTAGSGTIATQGGATFNFAYNAANFRRSDGTNDQCFDRSRANARRSVWQYGTYKASDGTRVDLANPGFPIQASYAGTSYFGFANYWGINFQGLDLNALADANPVSGLSITDQRPANAATYTLSKVGGKLTKWTQVQTSLSALDGIPFTFGADLTGQTSNPSLVSGWNNWTAVWSAASGFTVTGTRNCGPSGCMDSVFSGNASATINASFLNAYPIAGWSDSFGGNLNIPATGSPHAGADAVFYFTQATVIPGSAGAPTALHCLSQCPTAASIQAFAGGGSSASPYGNGTSTQWFSAPASSATVDYAFGASGLTESGTAMVLEQAGQFPAGSSFLQNGVNTGRLFDTAFTNAACATMPTGTVCEPANPTAYYTWSTGPNQWNQSLWLNRTGGAVVAFDAPQNIPYTVPSGAAYGSWAGKSILLQFNGFGNLFGVPGYCVDPSTNATVNCGPNTRYVPMFSIPDNDVSMTLPSPSTPLIVKALNAELRFADLGATPGTACAAMSISPLAVPTGGTHDPSSASDSEYLGSEPVVAGNPKVIDGIVQK